MCKSPWQTQTSPHSCVNPHNHRRRAEFFHLHGAPQQVPIAAPSRRCRSHCAQPPSNLEVNPPQTSASMLCFLWFYPPACFPPILFFSSACCICPICGGLLTSPSTSCTSEPRLSRVRAKKVEQTLRHPISFLPKSKHRKLASRMSSNRHFLLPGLIKW